MLQGQCQWKGIIKGIEVKGQGHFAILLVKKVQLLQLMTYLFKIEVNGSNCQGKHHIIDKVKKN